MKLVSVIIPTHDRPKTLRRAVMSVQNQSYPHIEIIIVNDGQKIIDQHIQNLGEFPIHVVQNKHTKGACGARNTGLEIATGGYISFLDDDDEYMPNCIEIFVNEIDKENTLLVYSGKNIVSNHGMSYSFNQNKILQPKWAILLNNFIGSTSSVLMRRNWKTSTLWFDESLTVLQDYDLFIKICQTGKITKINQPLINYYSGNSNQISMGTSNYWKSASMLLEKRRFGLEWTFQLLGLSYIYITKIIKSNQLLGSLFKPIIKIIRKIRQK